MKYLPFHLRLMSASTLAILFSGCSDANVDLQQQITVLREELEKARSEKISVPVPVAPGKPPLASAGDPETLKQNYEKSGRALRAALEKELSGVQLESFTLYQPKLDPHPHRSEFSMEFKTGGVKFSLDRIPVKGSLDGEWFFPSVEAVVAQVERVKATALAERVERGPSQNSSVIVSGPQARSTPSPAQGGGREPAPPANANKTIAIEWDTRAGSSQSATTSVGIQSVPRQQNSAPPQPVQDGSMRPSRSQEPTPTQPPARQGSPSSVMPAQREVQIKF